MGRNQFDAKFIHSTHLILLLIGLISCIVAYVFLSFLFRDRTTSLAQKGVISTEGDDDWDRGCCRGIAHLELWGDAVKWGSEFKVKSSEECCRACKEMCKGVDGPCLCDSWVFCGDREACGSKFGEAPFGPPFALIQGTLEAGGTIFRNIPKEESPKIRRGSVALVGSGPEFFISLANHNEWKQAYTVFGSVLPEDMEIVERIVRLPAKQDLWSNINVSVLESPVPFIFRRIKASFTNLKS